MGHLPPTAHDGSLTLRGALRSRGAALRCLVLVLAFALRLVGSRASQGHGYEYWLEMADHVRAGEGLHRTMPWGQGERWAIRTPGYPLLLTGLGWLPGPMLTKVAILGALAGTVSVAMAWMLATALWGARAGVAAGVVVALWPEALVHDGALQETSLYAALLLAFIVVVQRLVVRPERAAATTMALGAMAGILGAAAVLVRVTLLPTVLLVLAWATWVSSAPLRSRLAAFGLACALLALGLAPWLARNARVVGAPVLTTDMGRSLWLGNNPQTFSVYPRQSIDRSEERAWLAVPAATREHVRSLAGDERAQDAWFRREALAYMAGHPWSTAWGGVRKAWASFSPWHDPEGAAIVQAAHLLSYGPVAVLALAALVHWRSRWRETGLLALPVLALAVHSAVFFGHSSYRAYLDPLLVVLASAWMTAALDRRASGPAAA